MGQKVFVENKTEKFMHVGPYTIQPGHGMEVEEEFLPGYKPPVAAAAVVADLVADLQKEAADKVLEGVKLLNDPDLQRLIEIERAAKKPRKSLLEKLDAIVLERASAAAAALGNADAVAELQSKAEAEVLAKLADLVDVDLQLLADLETAAKEPRKAVLDAVTALQAQRAGGGQ